MSENDFKWIKDSLRYLCAFQNMEAESTSYGWTYDFSIKELYRNKVKFYENETICNHFDLSKLTVERCKAIGFRKWDEESDVLLFPLWYVPFLKDGQIVTDIEGNTYAFKKDNADLDARFGCVAFGIRESSLIKEIVVQ